MGGEVEEVPESAPVDGAKVLDPEGFGRWFQEQRELRGISTFVVGARTKLPPDRVSAIEAGHGELRHDGLSRLTVRQLALSIGADPDQALARLLTDPTRVGSSHPRLRSQALFWRLLPHAVAVLALGIGVWGLALWLGSGAPDGEPAQVLHRTDYVREALDSTP